MEPVRGGSEARPERRERVLPVGVHRRQRRPARPPGDEPVGGEPLRRSLLTGFGGQRCERGQVRRTALLPAGLCLQRRPMDPFERVGGRPSLDLSAGLGVLAEEVQHLDPPRAGGVRLRVPRQPRLEGLGGGGHRLAGPGAEPRQLSEPDPVEALDRGPNPGRDPAQLDLGADRRGGDGDDELEDELPREDDPHRRRGHEREHEGRSDGTVGRLGDQAVAHAARAARTWAAHRRAGVGHGHRIARRDQGDADQERSQPGQEHRHDEQRRAVPAKQVLHEEPAPDRRPRDGHARHQQARGSPPAGHRERDHADQRHGEEPHRSDDRADARLPLQEPEGRRERAAHHEADGKHHDGEGERRRPPEPVQHEPDQPRADGEHRTGGIEEVVEDRRKVDLGHGRHGT